ncbi:MAG: zinc metalloprotease, partial [Clostridia bacterium]|nr:zinc metalloprotease [Clostridia bacterium]
DAMIKVTVGTQKKAKKMSEREKRNTAVHEAGHAILAHVLETQDPVRQISIIPSGRALGYTLTPPTEDKYSESKKEMEERIAMMLGGRVAEQIVFNDYTGGASNDIMRATETARKMVTVYGMSEELGTIHFGSNHGSDEVFLGRDFGSTPNYSESTAAKIDAEIKKIINNAYNLAYTTIEKYRDKLDFVTEFLLKYEIMDDEQFALAMTEGVTMEQVENLVTEKKRRSEEENRRRKEKLEEEKKKSLEERRRLERELGILDDDDDSDVQLIEEASESDSESDNSIEIESDSQEQSIDTESVNDDASSEDDNDTVK